MEARWHFRSRRYCAHRKDGGRTAYRRSLRVRYVEVRWPWIHHGNFSRVSLSPKYCLVCRLISALREMVGAAVVSAVVINASSSEDPEFQTAQQKLRSDVPRQFNFVLRTIHAFCIIFVGISDVQSW